MRPDSGRARSRSMAATPSSGPGASAANAQRQAATAPEPGGHDLQRRRVDAGDEAPGGEPQRQRGRRAVAGGNQPVDGGGANRGGEEDPAGRDAVGRLMSAETSAPVTNPSWTAMVSHAASVGDSTQAARSCGSTAEAENQVVIDRTIAAASRANTRPRPAVRSCGGLVRDSRLIRANRMAAAAGSLCPQRDASAGLFGRRRHAREPDDIRSCR
jgi:hypothetical protein